MDKSRRALISAGILFLAAGALLFNGCRGKQEQPEKPPVETTAIHNLSDSTVATEENNGAGNTALEPPTDSLSERESRRSETVSAGGEETNSAAVGRESAEGAAVPQAEPEADVAVKRPPGENPSSARKTSETPFLLPQQGRLNILAIIGPTAASPENLPELGNLEEFWDPASPEPDKWTLFASDLSAVELPFAKRNQPAGPRQRFYLSFDWSATGKNARGLYAASFCPFTIFSNGKKVLDKDVGRVVVQARVEVQIPSGETRRIIVAVRPAPYGTNRIALGIYNSGGYSQEGNEVLLPLSPALSRSLLFKSMFFYSPAVEKVIREGEKARILCGFFGLVPKNAPKVGLRLLSADGKALAELPPRSPSFLQKTPFDVTVAVPEPAGEDYRAAISCVVFSEGQELGKRALYFLEEKSLSRGISEMEAAARQARFAGRSEALLALAKARIALGRLTGDSAINPSFDVERIAGYVKTARELYDKKAPPDEDIFFGKTGYLERAYISEIDGSAQPFRIYVPSNYDFHGTDKCPLVVFLHGYVPSYDRDRWLSELRDMNARAEKLGWLVVLPFGRSNTDFLNCGEKDILDVLGEMKRFYRIDSDRVFLTGFSMGGSGVYTVIAHYPGPWAAGIALSGRTDYWLWHKPVRERTPVWQKLSILADNPLDQVPNFHGVPMKIFHGGSDSAVSIKHSFGFQRGMRSKGMNVEVKVVPGGTHFIGWDILPTNDFWNFLENAPVRERQRYSRLAWSKKYTGENDTLRLSGFHNVLEPMSVDVRYNEKSGRVVLERFDNLDWMLIDTRARLGAPAEATFSLNEAVGKKFVAEQLGDKTVWRVRLKDIPAVKTPHNLDDAQLRAYWDFARKGGRPHKEGRWCGPVREIMAQPWVIVCGTKGKDIENQKLRQEAERLQKEWLDFARGEVEIITDADALARGAAETRSLFLLGSPATNACVAEAAGFLPVKWSGEDDRYVSFNGGKPIDISDRGMVFCYPDLRQAGELWKESRLDGRKPTANKQRLLVIQQGVYWGAALPINHKWDLVPDLIIYEKEPVEIGQAVNKPVLTAFFDYDWRANSATTWNEEESVAGLMKSSAPVGAGVGEMRH